jgi:hypothetical protein
MDACACALLVLDRPEDGMINVAAFVACARRGHCVVVADRGTGRIAVVSRLGIRPRVLAFLTHGRLSKHCDAVGRYAGQARREPRRPREVLVLALSKRYGEKAAQAVFAAFASRLAQLRTVFEDAGADDAQRRTPMMGGSRRAEIIP